MSVIPILYTPRLTLRPFSPADAARVQFLAGDARIAATTAVIPHPYPDGESARWIATHEPAAAEGREFIFAITLTGTRSPDREQDIADTGHLIGAIGFGIDGDPAHQRAALGYWIGVPYWNKNFATEAGHAVLAFAFTRLNYHRVSAWHFAGNPASGRVMQKLGMIREGTLRQHFQKNGQFHDIVTYGLLNGEWQICKRKSSFLKQKQQPRALAEATA